MLAGLSYNNIFSPTEDKDFDADNNNNNDNNNDDNHHNNNNNNNSNNKDNNNNSNNNYNTVNLYCKATTRGVL